MYVLQLCKYSFGAAAVILQSRLEVPTVPSTSCIHLIQTSCSEGLTISIGESNNRNRIILMLQVIGTVAPRDQEMVGDKNQKHISTQCYQLRAPWDFSFLYLQSSPFDGSGWSGVFSSYHHHPGWFPSCRPCPQQASIAEHEVELEGSDVLTLPIPHSVFRGSQQILSLKIKLLIYKLSQESMAISICSVAPVRHRNSSPWKPSPPRAKESSQHHHPDFKNPQKDEDLQLPTAERMKNEQANCS